MHSTSGAGCAMQSRYQGKKLLFVIYWNRLEIKFVVEKGGFFRIQRQIVDDQINPFAIAISGLRSFFIER